MHRSIFSPKKLYLKPKYPLVYIGSVEFMQIVKDMRCSFLNCIVREIYPKWIMDFPNGISIHIMRPTYTYSMYTRNSFTKANIDN